MECTICLSSVNIKTAIKCSEADCMLHTCLECLKDLIEFSTANVVLPGCPGVECKGYYSISSLRLMDVVPMAKAYKSYYSKEHLDNINYIQNSPKIIEDIRTKRMMYINSELPKAISFIAQIAYKEELQTIRSQQKLMAQKEYISKRKCLNHACKGVLTKKEAYLECSSCDQQFCTRCDLRYKIGHSCDSKTLDSIEFISAMVHCPKCKNPIERSIGCDHMRCIVCGTHFNYNSGEFERLDLHNPETKTLALDNRSILFLVADSLEKHKEKDLLIPILSEFEQRNIKKPSMDKLLSNIVSLSPQQLENPQQAINILKLHETYQKALKQYKTYINAYNEIVENISKLTYSQVKQIINQ